MKILTTIKKVVDVELTIRVENGAIVEDGLQYVMNAWDENAVEAAVQLKENIQAETTLVSIGGGEDNTKIIRRGFAMGIENAIQIDDPALAGADSFVYANVMQKVYEKGSYDLVITGKQAQATIMAKPESSWRSGWDCLASAMWSPSRSSTTSTLRSPVWVTPEPKLSN